jgi:hypothetical protein
MDQQNEGSKQTASSNAGKIAAKSHEAAEQWKEAVVGQVNETRDRVLSAKEHTAERIRGVATQLRHLSDTLREEDPWIADVAQRGSQGVDGLARYVSNATPQSVISDTEQLARRQPALFYGAALLLGLAAGRFVKSSRPQLGSSYSSRGGESRYDDRDADQRGDASYAPSQGERSAGQWRERESGFFASPSDNAFQSGSTSGENESAFQRASTAGSQGSRESSSKSPPRASTGASRLSSNESAGGLGTPARKGSAS